MNLRNSFSSKFLNAYLYFSEKAFSINSRMGLDTKNLSRTIEDAGTVIEPLLPWTSAGVYMATTLGVSTLDLLPWAIQCYAAIFFALIYGFSGVGIARTASASEKSPQTSVTK